MTVPPSGWYVEIDDPQSGHTWTPDVLGEPEINPGANGNPTVAIPVDKNERWFEPRYESAEMRVWKDGKRQPIDQLETPVETESGFRLEGRGGVELDTGVQKEVSQREAHLVAEELINNNTSYAANVDAPNALTRENESVQTADSQSEWDSQTSIADTTPIQVTSSGRLEATQVGFFAEVEDLGSDGSTQSNSDASNGEEVIYSIGGDSFSFTLEHTIPESEVEWAMRYRNESGSTIAEIAPQIDFQTVENIPAGALNEDQEFSWFRSNQWDNGDLTAGSHDGGFELGSDGDDIIIDCIFVYDARYSYDFDDTVDADGYLSGPQTKPDLTEAEVGDAVTAFQFTGARLESSFDDTSNNQRVGVSNDQGQSYTYANNSETVETDFGSGSAEIRAKFALSRYGSRSDASPTTGFKGQSVDLYELFGDIDETPLLINQDYDDKLDNVLQDIADYADFIYEYRLENGSPSIEMTVPGQRSAPSTPTPSGYEFKKTTEEQAEEVIVKGGRQRQREETFTADHGNAVDLEHGNIDHGTDTVYDPSTGAAFVEGEDYRLSPGVESDTGSITTLASGPMSDGSTYAIDYNYHEQGTWTSDSAGNDPKPLVRTIPSVQTSRGCEQAATVLGRQIEDPLEEVSVTLPTSEVGFNVVDAQQFSELPSDTALEIREITTKPGQTVFRLGSRESISDIVGQIKRRLGAASKRT